jgi:hypothetical protein
MQQHAARTATAAAHTTSVEAWKRIASTSMSKSVPHFGTCAQATGSASAPRYRQADGSGAR